MSEWVAVVSEEGDEPIEIPTESDGTMLLSTLSAQFPKVTGLKFRNPETNNLRGVRCQDNCLFPPFKAEQSEQSEDEAAAAATQEAGQGTWGGLTYICNLPPSAMKITKKVSEVNLNATTTEAALKRKSENDGGLGRTKNQRFDENDDSDDLMDDDGGGDGGDSDAGTSGTADLIVLGLPWVATDTDIKEYFETFGPLSMVQLKREGSQGKSKGFAFIRFKEIAPQEKVLLTRHMIKDRWCDVKVPESQELKVNRAAASCKIFVTNITEATSNDDLKEHFETFGTVTDVYVPKPHRAFAFISFSESRVAQSLFGKDHVIKGVKVHIGQAKPKGPKGSDRHGGGNDRDHGYDHGGRLPGPVPMPYGQPGRGDRGHGGYGGGQQGGFHSPWMSGSGPSMGQDPYSNYRHQGHQGRAPPRGYY